MACTSARVFACAGLVAYAHAAAAAAAAVGQEIEVKVRFTPWITGPTTLYGVCNLVGVVQPCGFSVSR